MLKIARRIKMEGFVEVGELSFYDHIRGTNIYHIYCDVLFPDGTLLENLCVSCSGHVKFLLINLHGFELATPSDGLRPLRFKVKNKE